MNFGKDVALYLLKVFVFVLIFWSSWIYMFGPLSELQTPSSVVSDVMERQQFELYSQQLRQANEQLTKTEEQQKKMDALLTQYEQHVKRYEVVLQKWEKQTGIQK